MEVKEMKFAGLFPHQSFKQWLSTNAVYQDLMDLLTESEIDRLVENNVVFVFSCSPSSNVRIPNVNDLKSLVIINFDKNMGARLLPFESLAILLHEIGHAFNPEVKGIDGEFMADRFAKQKGQGRWIISALRKGVKNNWLGFDQGECDLRIQRLQKNLIEEDD